MILLLDAVTHLDVGGREANKLAHDVAKCSDLDGVESVLGVFSFA